MPDIRKISLDEISTPKKKEIRKISLDDLGKDEALPVLVPDREVIAEEEKPPTTGIYLPPEIKTDAEIAATTVDFNKTPEEDMMEKEAAGLSLAENGMIDIPEPARQSTIQPQITDIDIAIEDEKIAINTQLEADYNNKIKEASIKLQLPEAYIKQVGLVEQVIPVKGPKENYMFGFAEAFNSSAAELFRTVDRGLKLFGDATGMEWKGALFSDMADVIEGTNTEEYTAPETILGNVVSGMGSIVPDLLATATMPEMKLAQLGRWTGGLITKIPKFPVLLGTKQGLAMYEEEADVKELFKGFAEGYTEGLVYEAMGLTSKATGELVSSWGASKPISEGAAALAEGSLFGSHSIISDPEIYNGGDINWDNFWTQFGMGLAFRGKAVGKSIKQKIIADMMVKKSYANYYTSTRDQVRNALTTEKSSRELRAESNKLWTDFTKAETPAEKNQYLIAKHAVDNQISLNLMVKDVANRPDFHKDKINESERLSDSEKEYYVKRIEDTVTDYDAISEFKAEKEKVTEPIKKEIEAEQRPSYQLGEKDITREEAETIIDEAMTIDDLAGLTVKNDNVLQQLIGKQFPKKEIPKERIEKKLPEVEPIKTESDAERIRTEIEEGRISEEMVEREKERVRIFDIEESRKKKEAEKIKKEIKVEAPKEELEAEPSQRHPIPAELLAETKSSFDKSKKNLSEADASIEAFKTIERSDWYKNLDSEKQKEVKQDYGNIITERFTERPTEKKTREKLPSEGEKISVNEAAALKDQIKLEARAARDAKRLTDKEFSETSESISEKLKGAVDAKFITPTQYKSITRRLGKANTEKKRQQALDYVDEVVSKTFDVHKKIIESDISDLVSVKTQEARNKIKKAKGGAQQVKYYLDEAKNIFSRYKAEKQFNKSQQKRILSSDSEAQRVSKKAANERSDSEAFNSFNRFMDEQLEGIEQRKLSDDVNEREKAIYEEIALIDMKEIWDAEIEGLSNIKDNINRTITEGKSKLKADIEKEVTRRNDLKLMAREQTRGRFAGKTKREIQNQQKMSGWNRIKTYMSEPGRSFDRDFIRPVTSSFDFMLKFIESRKSEMGEGRIYEKMMKGENGWYKSRKNYLKRKGEITGEIESGQKKVYGKKLSGMQVAELSTVKSKTGIHKLDKDGNRETINESMSESQGMYLYALSKMEGSKEKLKEQGWDETALEQTSKFIGKENVEYVDWVTGTLLPELHKDYNQTHIDIFRTPLDKIDNYIPIRYDAVGGIRGEGTIKIGGTEFLMPSAMPKHIKHRVANLNELSSTSNFFGVVDGYIESMEMFHNYQKFAKDMNVLFADAAVRNNIENNAPGAFKDLIDATNRAIGADKSGVDNSELFLHKMNRATALSRIAVRLWTAGKQSISHLAFLEHANKGTIKIGDKSIYLPMTGTIAFEGKMIAKMNPVSALSNHKFFMKNSEFYRERYKKGDIGDEEIQRGFRDAAKIGASKSKYAIREAKRGIANVGLFANRLMDSMAITSGGKTLYNQQMKHYQKDLGWSKEKAHKQSIMDFDLAYNLAQQSSEKAFIGEVQGKKNLMKSAFATFKNSQFSYMRKVAESHLDIVHGYRREYDKAYKAQKQKGIGDKAAKTRAAISGLKYAKSKGGGKALKKMAIYGYALPLAWQWVASGLPGSLTEWDDEDTMEMKRALIMGPLDGAYILSDIAKFGYDKIVAKKSWNYNPIQLIQKINETSKDVSEALEAEGVISMDVMTELARQIMIYGGGVDIENLDLMYDGAKDLIENGEWTEENILKLMNAPKSVIEGTESGRARKATEAFLKR